MPPPLVAPEHVATSDHDEDRDLEDDRLFIDIGHTSPPTALDRQPDVQSRRPLTLEDLGLADVQPPVQPPLALTRLQTATRNPAAGLVARRSSSFKHVDYEDREQM